MKKKQKIDIELSIIAHKNLKKATTNLLLDSSGKRQTNISQQLSKPACVRGKYRQGRIKYILIKRNIYILDYDFVLVKPIAGILAST